MSQPNFNNSSSSSSSSSSREDELNAAMELEMENMLVSSPRYEKAKKAHEDAFAAYMRCVEEGSSSSTKKKRRYINRDRVEGGERVYKDYFHPSPRYPADKFRQRYRMHRPLFDRIFNAVLAKDPYFQQQWQVTGEMGLTPFQKISAAFRILAYGVAADYVDEYLRMGETTALICVRRFCAAVIQCFAAEYLREPTSDDIAMLLAENEERGFPGMLGSIDCMHWKWKNCPKLWQATYTCYKKYPTIVLEGIASKSGWFWHAYFGMPGSLNDINVMQQSHVWERMMNGDVPADDYYHINGNSYKNYYYLGDGIYPRYSTIVKTVSNPRTDKEKAYASAQEAVRKDIERAFGMLQGRWAIIKQPAMYWSKEDLHSIMLACVIMHNMICEDENGPPPPCKYDTVKRDKKKIKARKQAERRAARGESSDSTSSSDSDKEDLHEYSGRYKVIADNYAQMHSHELHERMKKDLIEHIWSRRGNRRR